LVVVDGQPGPEYDEVWCPVFSQDGKRVAYASKKDAKWLVVVDGQPGPDYDWIIDMEFSPDGKSVAYNGYSPKLNKITY
jgi:roadblock/LC7 domain-containing protein